MPIRTNISAIPIEGMILQLRDLITAKRSELITAKPERICEPVHSWLPSLPSGDLDAACFAVARC
jgi:hypothetical protein